MGRIGSWSERETVRLVWPDSCALKKKQEGTLSQLQTSGSAARSQQCACMASLDAVPASTTSKSVAKLWQPRLGNAHATGGLPAWLLQQALTQSWMSQELT